MIFMRKNNFKQGFRKHGIGLMAVTFGVVGSLGTVSSHVLHAEEVTGGNIGIAQYSTNGEYVDLHVTNNYVILEKTSQANNWNYMSESEFLAKIGVVSDSGPLSSVYSNFEEVVKQKRTGTYSVLITGYDDKGNFDKIPVTVVVIDPKHTVTHTENVGGDWEITKIITGNDFVVSLSDLEELGDSGVAQYARSSAWTTMDGQIYDYSDLVVVYQPFPHLYPDLTNPMDQSLPTTPGVYDVMLVVYGDASMNMLVKMHVVE